MRTKDEGEQVSMFGPDFYCGKTSPEPFSSGTPKGEDFRIVLEEIVRIKASSVSVPEPDTGRWEPAGRIVLGADFSLAWRCLDAQYWGVPREGKESSLSRILQDDPPPPNTI